METVVTNRRSGTMMDLPAESVDFVPIVVGVKGTVTLESVQADNIKDLYKTNGNRVYAVYTVEMPEEDGVKVIYDLIIHQNSWCNNRVEILPLPRFKTMFRRFSDSRYSRYVVKYKSMERREFAYITTDDPIYKSFCGAA